MPPPLHLGKALLGRALDRLLAGLAPQLAVRLASHVLLAEGLAERLAPERAARLLRALDGSEGRERAEAFAQEGEDLVLARLFGEKNTGFYVDVGAHHPMRHSNTYSFYRRGWRGINIDATPGSMVPFRRFRPRDINIECLVASDPTPRPFFLLSEPALNTASPDLARARPKEDSRFQVIEATNLTPRRLASLLDEHMPPDQAIDFMSVDVEGLDLDVLRSNEWSRYRPRFLLVELLETPLEALEQHEIVQFLGSRAYRPIAKLYNTVIFREQP